ncbi:putative syntaxin [Cryptosporidium canis]|uniref:Syntaxin n=1 Tax=Cryptosporidium canis TaxID=195482 RepID=A0ABQ8PBB9_9CRYT|nr:putative syntaxin [Cryptosporidium canis]KAJ1614551.1 putative syntaxin [Cryptosporidium canis]
MIDLLYDLRKYAVAKHPEFSSAISNAEKGVALVGVDQNASEQNNISKGDGEMSSYYSEIRSIGVSLGYINKMIEEIRINKQRALLTTSSSKDEEISENLAKILDETHEKTVELKNNIEFLRLQNSNLKKKANKSEASEIMIRENLLQTISKRFRETIAEFQAVQSEYKAEMRNKIFRQIKIVYPDANQNTIESIADEDGKITTTQLIKMKLSGSHETIGNAITELQDRYRDIRKLEKSVEELQQLFIELASLINEQGEMLDHIEFSVSAARDYTEKADIELVSARKYQKKTQKKMLWIILCIFILIFVVLLPVVIGFAINTK